MTEIKLLSYDAGNIQHDVANIVRMGLQKAVLKFLNFFAQNWLHCLLYPKLLLMVVGSKLDIKVVC